MTTGLRLLVVALLVVAAGVLSLVFASSGVVGDDPERRIWIPDELLMDVNARVAYNDDEIFWRFEWDTDEPSIYHDYLVYQDGDWVRHGESPVGREPEGVYEDRLSFFLDDGSVDLFRQYGGFITIVSGMRFFTDQADPEESEAILGEGRDDVRKFLPQTRTDPTDWRSVRPPEELERLRAQGYFLDLWHWRAHRSNPIGFSDDEHILDYRLSDRGEAPFRTNWDDEAEQPELMFDPEQTGQHAMRWERVLNREYTQDDYYYLSDEIAVPFDPDREWQEGDVIPRRILQEPDEARGTIFGQGVVLNGKWQLDLRRALDTGYPQDDKILTPPGLYDVAFAVHRGATGSRWHYVSFPMTLGLGVGADIEAARFEGARPDWDEIEGTTIPLFYPGQIGWDHVTSRAHAGADQVEKRVPIHEGHSEDDIAHYAVESEFRSEIRRQWLATGGAWIFFVIATTVAVAGLAGRWGNRGRGP